MNINQTTTRLVTSTIMLATVSLSLAAMAQQQGETGATLKAEDGSALPDIGPIFFEFGLEDLTPESRANLDELAKNLVEHPELKVTIEGHADERGSSEFNIALGERRAEGARKYLIAKGAGEDQVRTISYGEERPVDESQTEEAWAKNRRDAFRMGGRLTPGPGDEGYDENADKNKDADKDKDKDADENKDKDAGQDKSGGDDGSGSADGTLFGQSYLFWGGVALTTVGVVGAVAGGAGTGVGVYLYQDPSQTAQNQQYGLYAAIGFGVLGVVSLVAAAAGGGIIAYDLLAE